MQHQGSVPCPSKRRKQSNDRKQPQTDYFLPMPPLMIAQHSTTVLHNLAETTNAEIPSASQVSGCRGSGRNWRVQGFLGTSSVLQCCNGLETQKYTSCSAWHGCEFPV